MFALSTLCGFLVLAVICGIAALMAQMGFILLSIIAAVVTAALTLPGFKALVNHELPKIAAMQCGELPGVVETLRHHDWTRSWITKVMTEKKRTLNIFDIGANGRLDGIFVKSTDFQNIAVDEIPKAAEQATTYPILLVNSSRLLGSSTQLGPLQSPGPIVIYGESLAQIEGLRVSSASAILFCNENLTGAGWHLDSPLLVASDVSRLKTMAEVINTQTPDGNVQLIQFSDILQAAQKMLVRMLKGDPLFKSADSHSDTTQKTALLRDTLQRDLKITTIHPSVVQGAATEPALAPPVEQTPQPQSARPLAPTAPAPAPEQVATEAPVDRTPLSTDLRPQDVIWNHTQCGFGFLYMHCQVRLDRRDLQFLAVHAFNKKGGRMTKEKHIGPADLESSASNPRLFFMNHEIGVQIDITVHNKSQATDKAPNTLANEIETAQPPQKLWWRERLAALGSFSGAMHDAVHNVERSLALALPPELVIRNVVATADKIQYDRATGYFYISDFTLRDFDVVSSNPDHPLLSKLKPALLSSISDYLKPYFKEHPVYDLTQVRVHGIPLAWFFVENVGIGPDDTIVTNLKWGHAFF